MNLIYQSPKTKTRSSPINENDTRSRDHLEGKGWRVVEEIEKQVEKNPTTLEGEMLPPVNLAVALNLTEKQEALLVEAGFASLEAIQAASDDELSSVKGIGGKTVKAIREAMTESEDEA